jgi:hypothetical protein
VDFIITPFTVDTVDTVDTADMVDTVDTDIHITGVTVDTDIHITGVTVDFHMEIILGAGRNFSQDNNIHNLQSENTGSQIYSNSNYTR